MIKEDLRKQVTEVEENKQKELYILMKDVKTQLLKENKKLSNKYMNLKNKRNAYIKNLFPEIERVDRVVIASLWAPLYNKFYNI